MKMDQVAAQLYTLRDFLKTSAEIPSALARVREMGYRTVQVSGVGPVADDVLAGLLQEADLACCATHEPGQQILEEPERVAARLDALGCTITAFPHPRETSFATIADVQRFAARLNHAGRVLSDAGKTLCYHNHQLEFRRLAGQTVLDVIFAETDPRYVQAELDTYWIQVGGGNPAEWCARMTNRLPIIHLKDYVIDATGEVSFAEVGSGNLSWDSIIEAADGAGCQWYCVEQDAGTTDPFRSLGQSYRFLEETVRRTNVPDRA